MERELRVKSAQCASGGPPLWFFKPRVSGPQLPVTPAPENLMLLASEGTWTEVHILTHRHIIKNKILKAKNTKFWQGYKSYNLIHCYWKIYTCTMALGKVQGFLIRKNKEALPCN